jgi:hypothetical protein
MVNKRDFKLKIMQPNHLNFEWELSYQSVTNLYNVTNAVYYKISAIYYYATAGWEVYTSAQGYDANDQEAGASEQPCISPCFAPPSPTPPSQRLPNETAIEVKLTRDQLSDLKSAQNTILITGSFEYQGGGTWAMKVEAKALNSLNGVGPCITPC